MTKYCNISELESDGIYDNMTENDSIAGNFLIAANNFFNGIVDWFDVEYRR